MKRLSFALHAGIFMATAAAFFGGAASAVPTDEMDGARSSLQTVYGETSSLRWRDWCLLESE